MLPTCALKVCKAICLHEQQHGFSVLHCQHLDSSSRILYGGEKGAVSALPLHTFMHMNNFVPIS